MTASVVVRRLAALSGASAVGAGAYGAHGKEISQADFPQGYHLAKYHLEPRVSGTSASSPKKMPVLDFRVCGSAA